MESKKNLRFLLKSFQKSPYVYTGCTDEDKNTNPELCSLCKGRCCKRCGCFLSPQDFKEISFKALDDEFKKGYISIDLVKPSLVIDEITRNTLVLRVRNLGAPIVDTTDKYRPRQCMMLTPHGCSFTYKKRPLGGKMFMPLLDGDYVKCYPKYSYIECAREWQPYQRLLKKLKRKYG